MEVVLYTRQQCHLCEEAKQVLKILQGDYSFDIREVDIDESDELTEQFGMMIPVVEIEGEIVQYGQIDLWTISNRLQQKS
ncbi:glutaredoxin family protein [Aeribacillus pallidus]|jgi:glutaredoxin|uniref:glutaredoxin family protein n=1 Tax=Aeribacillus pallidus TaxID=33936 RepID=UPI001E0A7618|nr:glutaredoxin family protein [Bacillus sp. (in: firmicutes)]